MDKQRGKDGRGNGGGGGGQGRRGIPAAGLAGWLRRMEASMGRRGRSMVSQLVAAVRSGGPFGPSSRSPPPSLSRRMPKVPKRVERRVRQLGPLLLLVCLLVYLLFGATAFLFFEHTNHEQTVRKWFFNLIVNRHKFARQISSAIFNGTRGMLVIVDYDSSERIQRDLVHLLSEYEQQLELRVPDLNEWTLTNSLTYCAGLLTTIGHGHRTPKTSGGRVFALLYCLLGVPFFLLTLICLAHRLFHLSHAAFHLFAAKRRHRRPFLAHHRPLLLLLLCALLLLWLLIFALLLHCFAMPQSFWRSFYTAVLASFTIQSADYNGLLEAHKLLTLGCAAISLLLSCLCLFSLTGVWQYGRRRKGGGGVWMGEDGGGKDDGKGGGGGRKVADENKGTAAAQMTKFQVIVDHIGSAKLAASAPNSPTEYQQQQRR